MNAQTEISDLTPAELGILAATLDDANHIGLGDDDTVQMLANIALAENMAEDNEQAWHIGYSFFRLSRF